MLGFLTGAGLTAIVFTFYWMGHFGLLPLCGSDQQGPVCIQQWLAAGGPTLALLFAAMGAKGLARQVKHGQVAVAATQRDQLRHEYQILSDIRASLLADQKRIEVDYEERYTDRSELAENAPWKELEAFQYEMDGFVEWIDSTRRDPYLWPARERLYRERRPIAARAEVYRTAARNFADGNLSRDKMALLLIVSILITIRDMEHQRQELESEINAVGLKVAQLMISS